MIFDEEQKKIKNKEDKIINIEIKTQEWVSNSIAGNYISATKGDTMFLSHWSEGSLFPEQFQYQI